MTFDGVDQGKGPGDTPGANAATHAGGHDLSRVHMVGVGGAGMSGLARILLSRGSIVSGSDMKDSRVLLALRSMGAHIAVGHDACNVTLGGDEPTVVVTSFAAIPRSNPELAYARDAGIPVITRSDLLAELMAPSRQVLFAGTHGKTSTTSMAVVAFQAAGADPSFAIGGQLNKAGTNAHAGTGDIFVAEADESDASLLSYRPQVAVVTNVEPDHLDFFGTEQAYRQVFVDFGHRVCDGGTVVVCLDDEGSRRVGETLVDQMAAGRPMAGRHVVGYGTKQACAQSMVPPLVCVTDIVQEPSGAQTVTAVVSAAALHRSTADETVTFRVCVPGVHMVLNACAALAAGVAAGLNPVDIARGLGEFCGVRRRFEHKGTIAQGPYAGTMIVDDYAHHPTEITALINAAKSMDRGSDPGPVVAVFQPHLYSRTVNFAREFAQALSAADYCIVCDVFPAREAPVEGVDGRVISDLVTAPVEYCPSLADVPDRVAAVCGPRAVVLTIGAGSITVVGPSIAARLAEATGDRAEATEEVS